MIRLYHDVCNICSRVTTIRYSTSFSSAIRLLHKDLRQPIYNIYGLVRFADEIVDTFHEYDKPVLLEEFRLQVLDAVERGISLNPILHSFQQTANKYNIDMDLVEDFFKSMKSDLTNKKYDDQSYNEYIYGSAEVVGLMCLQVFCEGNKAQYEVLKPYARALGAAFQKVNFLRDMKADRENLDRIYFPGIDFRDFSVRDKQQIEVEIENDFLLAEEGIRRLPPKAKFGVYVAFRYYYSLFKKIKKSKPSHIFESRVRISNPYKVFILLMAGLKNQFGI